jgi:hypothetical protein
MFRQHLKITVPAALLVIAALIAAWFALMGPGHDSADGTSNDQSKALVAATATTTPTPASTKSTTPSPTVSSPTSKPTPTPSTVAPKPSPATEPPAKTAAPTKPVVVDEGEEVVIGGLRITLPGNYTVDRADGLEAFAVGPDTMISSNHYYQSILRMSANGFNDMPEELGALMEGICPSGGDVLDYDQKTGEDTMDGDKLVFSRDIYVCPGGQSYNYASWQLEVAGTDGYRFIADYFYPADRRPSELTEAFINAKSFGHN